MKTEKRKMGDLGEALACQFLHKRRFKILERNFLRPCGEIDIIVLKDEILYFVEVKTVTYKTPEDQKKWGSRKPEDSIGYLKISRLRKVVALYLREHKVKNNWRFMVISVTVEKIPNGKIKVNYNVLYDVL